ncbi:Protein of unknown function [Alteromonadaceae bacterium Bs31]|nr:Protein of unknown function [Alteromonadaceae bacterium Bs31]
MSDIEPPTLFFRAKIGFFILALSATVFEIVVHMGSSFLTNTQRLSSQNVYVSVSSWDVPLFIGIPTLLSLIFLLALKLINKEPEAIKQKALKIAIFFALGAIVLRIPYGFTVSSIMQKKGYSRCWEYSSAAMMSPTVWVKEPAYCIANSGSVRRDVLKWLDDSKQQPSPQEVKEKVNLLLEEYDRSEREKYPALYD